MTSREKTLLGIFVSLCILAVFALYNYSLIARIRNSRQAIQKYSTSIEALPSEKTDSAAIREEIRLLEQQASITENPIDTGSTEIASKLKKSFSRHGIIPRRMQTGISDGKESIDFYLECDSMEFFSFLKEYPQAGKPWTYTSLSIQNKPDTDSLSISVRLRHE